MAPKPPPYWDLYREQTIPVADSKRIQPGDVGYVRKGRFHLLFSASLSPVQESDAPQSFEILTVGRIVCDVPVPAGPLKTETAQVIKERLIPIPSPTPASSPPSSSSGEKGALLLTKYPMYREDVEREGHFKEYTRKHYNSWVEFARQNGHGDGDLNPVLVTGVDRTRDFVMLCYSKDNDRVINCEFTTPIPGANDYGKWNFPDEFVHTNHSPQTLRGPLPTQVTDPTSSGDNDPETISDQHVFIRYFTVRKRLWVPMVIKASAGPHELGGGGYGYDDDGSPLEVLCGSDQGPDLLYTPSNLSDGDGCSPASTDTECDSVVHNIRAGGRDDFDVIADYVFQVSWEQVC
ncbi:hypothetical protein BJ322DRAFT_393495 [Thelephora terrestris]|uniref:Uncharacterized protein n=1 Tax=Thelephora terrestris TaxID=56493 RepID=A0A9P6HME7_9AGAM|nr:hypothetical protein BJ322DRAFT_393495 [Thelephora terrestris]